MRSFLKKLLGVASLSTLMFIFEACYGAPPDMGYDLLVEGKVVSAQTGNPIKGISVSVKNSQSFQVTDSNGNFSFYTDSKDIDSITVEFKNNNNQKKFDTTVAIKDDKVYLTVKIQE